MTKDEAIQRAQVLQDKIFMSYNLIQYLGGDPNSVRLPRDGDWFKWLTGEIYRASQPDRNMDGADEFIRAVLMNQPIWPNNWGQHVAAAAFFLTNNGQRATALETGMLSVSEKADALRFRFWTAMIQNQPNAIQKFEDYSNPDDIRKKLDEWRGTLTLCNEVFKAIRPLTEPSPRFSDSLVNWLAHGERGISSETIVQHLTGLPCLRGFTPSHPLDPSDLGRCRLLLEQVPELVQEFPRMAELSHEWAVLVGYWPELCAKMDEEAPEWREKRGMAPKTYNRMWQLIKDARRE